MPTTQDILNRHLKSFGENDLNGVLADYSSDAVLFVPGASLKGAAIQTFFEGLLAEFAKPGASFSMREQRVEGDYAYILWSAETADNSYQAATDTFVVRDGKIVAQSFAANIVQTLTGKLDSRATLGTAGEREEQLAGVRVKAANRR
jgi:hypothetical protein